MKIVIIATEASSDYLGYNLIKSLRKKKKKINLYGVGGPLMESIGLNLGFQLVNLTLLVYLRSS